MTTVYETLERPLSPVLGRMERRGISIDRQMLSRLSGEFAQRRRGSKPRSTRLAGEPFNPGSPKQLGDILFGKMGLPGGTKTKTGAWSTGARRARRAGRARPRAAAEDPRLAAGLEAEIDLYRRAARLTSIRHTTASIPPTRSPRRRPGGCRRSSPTCRTSRSAPRKAARSARAFVAAPGNKLVSADYSQIELRLLAEIADVPALRAGLPRRRSTFTR